MLHLHYAKIKPLHHCLGGVKHSETRSEDGKNRLWSKGCGLQDLLQGHSVHSWQPCVTESLRWKMLCVDPHRPRSKFWLCPGDHSLQQRTAVSVCFWELLYSNLPWRGKGFEPPPNVHSSRPCTMEWHWYRCESCWHLLSTCREPSQLSRIPSQQPGRGALLRCPWLIQKRLATLGSWSGIKLAKNHCQARAILERTTHDHTEIIDVLELTCPSPFRLAGSCLSTSHDLLASHRTWFQK